MNKLLTLLALLIPLVAIADGPTVPVGGVKFYSQNTAPFKATDTGLWATGNNLKLHESNGSSYLVPLLSPPSQQTGSLNISGSLTAPTVYGSSVTGGSLTLTSNSSDPISSSPPGRVSILLDSTNNQLVMHPQVGFSASPLGGDSANFYVLDQTADGQDADSMVFAGASGGPGTGVLSSGAAGGVIFEGGAPGANGGAGIGAFATLTFRGSFTGSAPGVIDFGPGPFTSLIKIGRGSIATSLLGPVTMSNDFTQPAGMAFSFQGVSVSTTPPSVGQVLRATAGNAASWQNTPGGTLAASYASGASQTDSTLLIDSTRLGLVLKDNATPIAGSLLSVKDNANNPLFAVDTTLHGGAGGVSASEIGNSAGGGIFIYPEDGSAEELYLKGGDALAGSSGGNVVILGGAAGNGVTFGGLTTIRGGDSGTGGSTGGDLEVDGGQGGFGPTNGGQLRLGAVYAHDILIGAAAIPTVIRGSTTLSALTANTALVLNGSKALTSSSTTDTELAFVHGVSSAIQTQLDGKQASGSYLTALTGDATAAGPGSAAITLAASGVTAATYGSSSTVGAFTVDAKGRITSATDTALQAASGTVSGVVNTAAQNYTGVKNFLSGLTVQGSINRSSSGSESLFNNGNTTSIIFGATGSTVTNTIAGQTIVLTDTVATTFATGTLKRASAGADSLFASSNDTSVTLGSSSSTTTTLAGAAMVMSDSSGVSFASGTLKRSTSGAVSAFADANSSTVTLGATTNTTTNLFGGAVNLTSGGAFTGFFGSASSITTNTGNFTLDAWDHLKLGTSTASDTTIGHTNADLTLIGDEIAINAGNVDTTIELQLGGSNILKVANDGPNGAQVTILGDFIVNLGRWDLRSATNSAFSSSGSITGTANTTMTLTAASTLRLSGAGSAIDSTSSGFRADGSTVSDYTFGASGGSGVVMRFDGTSGGTAHFGTSTANSIVGKSGGNLGFFGHAAAAQCANSAVASDIRDCLVSLGVMAP